MNLRMVLAAVLVLGSSYPLAADQLRYDSARDWRQWENLPLGAVELTTRGVIQPIRIEKGTDAVRDLDKFGGGIRNAGSNLNTARLAIDGDPATGWAPDPEANPDEWFIEIDLGRAVSARSVTLVFDAQAAPFALFDLLLSTGEPETDFIAAPIEGSLVYRTKERFKENARHRVTYLIKEIDAEPLQFIRFEPLLVVPGARLAEVEVETIGDNIALGLLERGGAVDVNINLSSTDQQPLGKARALFDGDLYEHWAAGTASRGQNDILAHIVLDLGAVYWVNQTRIIGGVVVRSGFGGGITTRHYVSRRRWGFRFYEFMTSDGSLSPDGTRLWTKHFSGASPGNQTSNARDARMAALFLREVGALELVETNGQYWVITIAAERGVSLADRRSLVEAALTRHKKQQANLAYLEQLTNQYAVQLDTAALRQVAAGTTQPEVRLVRSATGDWSTADYQQALVRLGAGAEPLPADVSALGFKVTRAFVADQILPQEARKHGLSAELEPRRAKVREQKLIQALWEREIFAHIQIDPAQVRAFYEANAQRYAGSGASGRELQAQVARDLRDAQAAPLFDRYIEQLREKYAAVVAVEGGQFGEFVSRRRQAANPVEL